MEKKNISLFLAVVLLLSCLSGCAARKAAVTAAVSASAAAFSRAADAVLPEESFSPENGYSQETVITLSGMPGELSFLNGGLSVRVAGASEDGECRESQFEFMLGSLSVFTLSARTEGRLCTLSCPLLGNPLLINMDTLPEDLNEMGLGSLLDGEGAGFSAISAAAPSPEFVLSDAEEAELFDALKALAKDIDVKNSGTKKANVNGYEKSCHYYAVIVPSADLCRLWDAISPALLRTLKEAPVLLEGAEESADPEELLSDLRAALISTGSWTLELGICDKVVMSAAVDLSGSFRGSKFSLRPALTVGGGEEYVDDLALCVAWGDGDDKTLEWYSHGDHTAKTGAFTDESSLSLSGEEVLLSKLRYADGEKKDNLKLELNADDTSIVISGTLLSSAEELSFTDGNITLEGEKSAEYGVESRMSAYAELVPPVENAAPLSETSWSEIYNFLGGFLEKLDGLSDLFDAA